MALNIRNPETEELAATLAELTGESKTRAVTEALKERIDRVRRGRRDRQRVLDRLNEIAKHCASLPVLDDRSPEEMLYGEDGLPR